MAAKYWLKLYYEMLDDAKVGKLRASVKWRFIETLLVAGECDEDGFLPPIDHYAWRVRADSETVETDFGILAEAGLLSQADGRWFVTKFKERQAPVSGAERVAKYRERQKKQEYYEDVTQPLPNGNEPVTNRYTDTDKIRLDKDTDKIQMPVHLATADMLNEWGEWLEYHKERGKPLTRSTAKLQFKQFDEWGEERSIAALKYSRLNNYTGLIEPKGNNQHKETPAERIARLEKEMANEGLD